MSFLFSASRTQAGRRSTRAMLFVCSLCLFLMGVGSQARSQDTLQSPPADNVDESDKSFKEGKSLLLFVLQHAPNLSAKREELNIELASTLHETLMQRFDVLRFNPSRPVIKRALAEHTITAADLVEPASMEALQRVASAVGARYILLFGTTIDGSVMKTNIAFWEQPNQQGWVTRIGDQINTDIVLGKRPLKSKELAALATDAIAARMNVPSNQAEKLHFKPTLIQHPQVARAEKKSPRKSSAPGGSEPDEEASTLTSPQRTADGTDLQNGAKKPQAREIAPSSATDTSTSKPNEAGGAPSFTTDTARGQQLSSESVLASPQNVSKPDLEAMAARFRQTGDLANVIVALRHAVNDRPRDIGLRRQLVQAYKERQLYDAALAEASRALELNPNDSSLHRLYGDALLAHGDSPRALKAYQEAIQLDPNDVASQVALGDALLTDNQYAEALDAYAVAAKSDPKSPLPHRRLARALAMRAGADTAQYATSLAEIQQARALTPSTDIETYQEDYIALMQLMDMRLHRMVEQIQNTYQAQVTGKRTLEDVKRISREVKDRAEAAVDYLDKLPVAVGQGSTHLQYQQGAAFVLQTIDLYRDFLVKGDTNNLKEQIQGAEVDALRALDTAAKHLNAKPSGTPSS